MSFLKRKILSRYTKSALYILEKLDVIPDQVLIAGSGIADVFEKDAYDELNYSEIPGMPIPSVEGHGKKIILTEVSGKVLLIFTGRFHLYEGRTAEEVISLTILSKLIGCKNIIITNAAGGLDVNYKPGDIMIINDIINFTGKRIYEHFNLGTFIGKVSNPYLCDQELLQSYKNTLVENKLNYQIGTYLGVTGPSYETAAEVRMFRAMGANAIGMSTVLEMHTAKLLDMNVIGLSLITNSLAEINTKKLHHQEVIDVAMESKPKLKKFIELATSL